MKRIKQIALFVFFLSFIACKRDEKIDTAFHSAGKINEVAIIINDILWNGEVGDGIRKKLAAPIDGLQQEEPLFTIHQYPEKIFNGPILKTRNIIIVEKGDDNAFSFNKNKFSAPQNVFTITGKSIDDLLRLIEMHSDEIIKIIRETEILENQARNKALGLLDTEKISNQYNIQIELPLSYNYAIENDSFLWLKKDIPGGNCNLLIYEVPYDVIEKDKTIINNIIKMRDSIGGTYIKGQDPKMIMVTEEAYSPYLFTTSFKDKMAFETRGNWEMENDFMNGPFVNYSIKDVKNNRYLVIEGFIYSPSSPKRDLVHELEAIIKSIKFL